ncbi:MAG TPA: peptidoglycan-binding protein, partial [Geobacteraceae bacterium]
RITVRYHLRPMDFADTVAYIEHRLEVAGGKGGVAFSRGALRLLYRAARGIPRLVNVICDRVLLIGYAEDQRQITARMMDQAIAEIGGERQLQRRRRRLLLASCAVVCVTLLVAVLLFADRGWWRAKQTVASDSVSSSEVYRQLATQREVDSCRDALNVVLSAWGAPAVSAIDGKDVVREMEAAVRERGFTLSRVTGSIGLLQRLDLPVVLELTLPGATGKRFLALTGADNGRLHLKTSFPGGSVLSGSDLDRIWAGRAYAVWRDPLGIRPPLRPGARGKSVKRLQLYLRNSGLYDGEVTRRFDPATVLAVKRFQSNRGIPADGTIEELTLLFICRAGEGKRFPALVKQTEEGR